MGPGLSRTACLQAAPRYPSQVGPLGRSWAEWLYPHVHACRIVSTSVRPQNGGACPPKAPILAPAPRLAFGLRPEGRPAGQYAATRQDRPKAKDGQASVVLSDPPDA